MGIYVELILSFCSTMMAILAPGDPPLHPKTVACLLSVPEDEDIMVFSAFHPVSLPFSLHTHCGTNHNIENTIANISSGRSTKSDRHAPKRLAVPSAMIILAPLTPPFPSKHLYDDNNAPHLTIGCCGRTYCNVEMTGPRQPMQPT